MYPRMYRMAIFELNWFEARCEAAPPAALLLLLKEFLLAAAALGRSRIDDRKTTCLEHLVYSCTIPTDDTFY